MRSFFAHSGCILVCLLCSPSSHALIALNIDFDSQVELVQPGFSSELDREFFHIMFLGSALITQTITTAESSTYTNPVGDILRFASDGAPSEINGITRVGEAISEVTITDGEYDALYISVENLDSLTGKFWRIELDIQFGSDTVFNSTELTELLNAEAILMGLNNTTVNTLTLFDMSNGELVSQGRINDYAALDRLAFVPVPGASMLYAFAIVILARLQSWSRRDLLRGRAP